MEEKAYIHTEKFAKGFKGNRAFNHRLRERVFKDGLSKDKINIFGDPRCITHQAQPLSQKSKGYFFEVMASGYDPKDTTKIIDYLEDRLKRKVVAVEHNDETTFHCHFMAAWNDDAGRALRLSMKDFKEIPKEISQITGQKLTKQGEGRKRLSAREFYKDEKGAREKIAAMSAQKFAEKKKPILPIAPAVIGKTITNAQKLAEGDAKAGVMIGLTAAKIGFNVLDKVKDMMPPIVALSTPTAQPEPPVSVSEIDKESAVEINPPPMRERLGNSLTKDLTNNMIDNQHGIKPTEPKPEYSAKAENVAPVKSENKPVVAAPVEPEKIYEGKIRAALAEKGEFNFTPLSLSLDSNSTDEEIKKAAAISAEGIRLKNTVKNTLQKGDVICMANRKNGVALSEHLGEMPKHTVKKGASDDEIWHAVRWTQEKRAMGYNAAVCEKSKEWFYNSVPKVPKNPLKTAKKVMNKIDPAPPQQEQQADNVRIPFTPGR